MKSKIYNDHREQHSKRYRRYILQPEFERQLVEKEIADNRQWKMLSGDYVACIRATTFDDPQIWEERNADPAVYIHCITTPLTIEGKNGLMQL